MDPINREDYEEPRCVICEPGIDPKNHKQGIPVQRVVEKLDEYQSVKDVAGGERHLKYWLEEAKSLGDLKGEFAVRNEMMGFYRKAGREEDAFESMYEALQLIDAIGYEGSTSSGTCYVNCGTVCANFGRYEDSYGYFLKAKEVYEKNLNANDPLLAGLYNNTATTLVNLERYKEAEALYEKALDILKANENMQLDMAISYLNLADAIAIDEGLKEGASKIDECLDKAHELFEDPAVPRDGYYAFVAANCAPAYSCYGRFDYSDELAARSEAIYKGEL